MGRVFDDPWQHEAARVIVGIVTARPPDSDAAEALAAQLGVDNLSAPEVAAGAAILLGRILDDIASTFRMDRDGTVAAVGRWVAADEFGGRT